MVYFFDLNVYVYVILALLSRNLVLLAFFFFYPLPPYSWVALLFPPFLFF